MKQELSPLWQKAISIAFFIMSLSALIRYALVDERLPHYAFVLEWFSNWWK